MQNKIPLGKGLSRKILRENTENMEKERESFLEGKLNENHSSKSVNSI